MLLWQASRINISMSRGYQEQGSLTKLLRVLWNILVRDGNVGEFWTYLALSEKRCHGSFFFQDITKAWVNCISAATKTPFHPTVIHESSIMFIYQVTALLTTAENEVLPEEARKPGALFCLCNVRLVPLCTEECLFCDMTTDCFKMERIHRNHARIDHSDDNIASILK